MQICREDENDNLLRQKALILFYLIITFSSICLLLNANKPMKAQLFGLPVFLAALYTLYWHVNLNSDDYFCCNAQLQEHFVSCVNAFCLCFNITYDFGPCHVHVTVSCKSKKSFVKILLF